MKKLLLSALSALLLSAPVQAQDGPTMGWSSWNTFGVNINENLILRQADAMVTTGLKDVGFDHINIDDGYFGGRDATTGKLLIHPTRFPNGLRGIVDYIHEKGLKAGIYSDAGRNTCGSMFNGDAIGKGVGMLDHDQQDANLFFTELNFDFIKVDFCGGSWYHNEDHLVLDEQERYTAIAQAIRNTGRTDVRMNACRWAYPGTWVDGQAFSWRTTGDIYDGWESVKGIIAENLYMSAYSSKGHYNDMDMLEVGRSMTDEEDKTHFGLWCIMNSPLLIGCNLTNIKTSTLALLKNQELIALNQDPLYQQAYVAGYVNGCHILVKDIETLNGKKRAFAVYNPNDDARQVTVSFQSLDLGGSVSLRDVFARTDLGAFTNEYSVSVPAHGTRIYVAQAETRLERTLYEAETGYISVYQEVKDNQSEKTGIYSADGNCSGGYKAGWLGSSAANALEWRNVYSKTGGEYEMTIGFICGENRDITVSVNGQTVQTISVNSGGWGTVGTTKVTIQLAKGNNNVKLSNASGWMPDIDYMRLDLVQALGYGKGQNPVIHDRYTPDPAPYVHGDTLYLFVDHDEDVTENGYFTMKDWLLYSTVDMVNWTYRGTPINSATFSAWAKQDNDCWASQCIERNGKWYWYVTATIKGQAYPGIGVAVADSPTGPFHDPIGRPLVQGWFKIDPTVFIDDDGQAYLFYGNNNLWYTKLNQDMISISGGEIEVTTKDENAFGPFKGYNDDGTPKTNFEEASWIYKRGGKYYLEYAAGGVPEYMAYSTADNVTGPWTYRGKIMNQADNSFTIHGGSVEYRGHHYMFYHNGNLPGGGGFKRATCIEEYRLNADGSIPFIPFTSAGVESLQTVNPYNRQEAETINLCEGVRCEGDHNGCYVTNISEGDFIKVHGVDFGSDGAKTFRARVRSNQSATLVIRTGSQTGDIIGQVVLESTGGAWKEVTANLSSTVTGTTDLFFTFQGSGQSLFDFDTWQFSKESSQAQSTTYQNPVVFADFPDPDVIRVGDTYYMVSTTMHLFPGATIVKSTDLVHWEYCAQPLTQLANTDRYNLLNGENAYAAGMWACSMKYHNGKFHILINGNDAGGWLLTATDPEGEWQMTRLGRGYYDPGMLFDNGKVYVACGIGNIQMCELDENFNYIREVNVVSNKSGLEGCHLYKIGNYYYIYATYGGWPSGQVVFRSQNIFGPYEERMLVEKYINNVPNTIHQGALFDTPTGEWWTIMQQDLGCLGRMPNLQPVTWVDNWPVVGDNGIPYSTYNCPQTARPSSKSLPTTDQFTSSVIGMQWQWNHNPDNNAWSLTERPGWLRLKTSGVADQLTQARNMLTQRIFAFHNEPNRPSNGTVRIDVSNLQEGDRAGICIFQDPYAFLAVEKKNGQLRLLWRQDQLTTNNNFTPAEETMAIDANVIYLRAAVTYGTSRTQFSYSLDNKTFTEIGGQTSLGFNLSVFVGARFGLFCYATEAGHTGYADFDWFETDIKNEEMGDYELGDDIVGYAPTVWEGQTGEYGGLGHTAYERYNSGAIGVGDVLTQSLTGLKNGTYNVTLELAASFTPDRGFECSTGTGLSLAFANGEFRNLEVIERGWVSSVEPITISCTVTDGTLRYGIYNIADAGNWYVANVTSILYVSENTDHTFNINTSAQHGSVTADVSYAAAGTTVTLTATPDDCFEFDSFTVTTCTGEDVAVNGNTFVMPATDVTVTANFSLNYAVGDDIVSLAPIVWVGQTGEYGGLGHTAYERYNSGSIGEGDVLTQTLTGLKNGVYAVTLELAASFTSERGFDCPTGDGLSVAFANDTQKNMEVIDRGWVSSIEPVTLYATVTDGTLKYGIYNLQASGNWYIANVTGIKYVSADATLSYDLTVTEAGVATLYLPYDAAIPEADFFVATAVKSVSGTTAYLQEVHDAIPAQTGVMIFANPGQYTLSLSTTAADNVMSLLHGVLEDTPVSTLMALEGKSIYVLSRGIKEYTGFKRASTTVKTIPANRAYLPLDPPSEVNFINLSFGDPTAINNIQLSTPWSMVNGEWSMPNGQWFTLDGRRLPTAPTRPGLYILNGKKILVK